MSKINEKVYAVSFLVAIDDNPKEEIVIRKEHQRCFIRNSNTEEAYAIGRLYRKGNKIFCMAKLPMYLNGCVPAIRGKVQYWPSGSRKSSTFYITDVIVGGVLNKDPRIKPLKMRYE